MKMESDVFGQGLGSQTNPEIAERLFEENVVGATLSLINIARNASSDSVRLNAAKYVVDRVLGPSRKDSPLEVNPLDALIEEMRSIKTDVQH
jgi:hypothetical protein